MEEETEIEDIYSGELVNSWEDGNFVYVCFPWCTVNFPLEDFDNVVDELCELIQAWRRGSIEKGTEEVRNN